MARRGKPSKKKPAPHHDRVAAITLTAVLPAMLILFPVAAAAMVVFQSPFFSPLSSQLFGM